MSEFVRTGTVIRRIPSGKLVGVLTVTVAVTIRHTGADRSNLSVMEASVSTDCARIRIVWLQNAALAVSVSGLTSSRSKAINS
jgi:hypothetical protein